MKTTQKKTSLIILTLCVFVIFLWQLYSLLSSDMAINNNNSITLAAPLETQQRTVPIPTRSQQSSRIPHALQQQHTQTDKHAAPYLALVNHYKVVKMQHKLLQEELSIAKVRHQIAKLNKKPMVSLADMHIEADSFGINHRQHAFKNQTSLVYLDYQDSHWSAILKDNQGYHQVTPGALLSNQSKVIRINQSGVILQDGPRRFNLSFSGVTPLPNPHLPPPVVRKVVARPPAPKRTFAQPHKALKPISNTAIKTVTAEQHVIHHQITPEKKPALITKPIFRKQTKPAPTPSTDSSKHTLDETVILEMPAKSYTIRLKHSDNRDELIEYAKKNNMVNRTLLYSNKKNHKFKYTLVFGDYLTTRAAKSALKALPQESNKEQYAIKSLESIQKEIVG